nr:MAG TPA: hypothetical protein [Caudoviricetes sp.]
MIYRYVYYILRIVYMDIWDLSLFGVEPVYVDTDSD